MMCNRNPKDAEGQKSDHGKETISNDTEVKTQPELNGELWVLLKSLPHSSKINGKDSHLDIAQQYSLRLFMTEISNTYTSRQTE